MARYRAFSIYDSKIGTWAPPFFFMHLGQAVRAFGELVNDGQSNVSKYPTDFCLYEIGTYDDSTASLEALSPVHMVQTAAEAKYKPEVGLPFDKPVTPARIVDAQVAASGATAKK